MNDTTQETELIKMSFDAIQKSGSFLVSPVAKETDFEDTTKYKKIGLSRGQKMQLSAFTNNVPTVLASETIASAYTVSFPEGLPHTLTALKQGGFGSMVKGADGKIAGHASFSPLSSQAAVLGVFSAMSIATGQYFLTQINSELSMISMKLDKILEFLYGDKKAELMSELSFIKYAYNNYSTIMSNTEQKAATIVSIQEARKVAIKDIEFYMNDLNATAQTDYKGFKEENGLEALITKALKVKESLDLSVQLYVMSGLLEVYYAQNYDSAYIEYIDNDMTTYIDKYEKRILSSFSKLSTRLADYKPSKFEKIDKSPLEKKLSEIDKQMNISEESKLKSTLHTALNVPLQKAEYFIDLNGELYAKA